MLSVWPNTLKRMRDYIVTERAKIFICAIFAYVFAVFYPGNLSAQVGTGIILFALSFWFRFDQARWPLAASLWIVIALAYSFLGGYLEIREGRVMALYIFIPGFLIALGSGRSNGRA